ncbi:hypothetical protein Aph02nite_66090 [Actinoplanes philippinensis]|uniref:Uncharacterized protein n=1 Tax=Actinoplanes philippinensis TaxID=35752 RepID=A0A1I2L0X3_9ACTN|nr:hypothetical protein [Actinoplanes philippinensis]GIE80659.1 hypothetical protein Aph02nite_66090 [Actinoplanes philippinensis]SFF72944.1 hypothetical protein SAMN05421541_119135 [Actinoplanes philippinensis]
MTPDLGRITDSTAWTSLDATAFTPPYLTTYAYDGPFSDGPPAFDVSHDETALIYATNWGFTCTMPGVDVRRDADIAVPTGHTQLYTLEKRAVVAAGGTVLRIWPAAYPTDRDRAWRLIVPQTAEQRFRNQEAVPGIAAAIADAVALAARLDSPVLLARQVDERYWH